MLARLPRRLHLRARAAGGRRGRHGRRLRAGERAARRYVNLHTAPGRRQRDGRRSSTPRPTSRRCVITAGQQARSLMTLQANLTNRDAASDAAPARQVELRAAARRGRARTRSRARSTWRRCRRAGRCSSRSRWTTGAPRSTRTRSRTRRRATVTRPRARRPRRRWSTLARRLARAPRTRCWSPARTSTRAAAGTPRSRSPSAQRLPVWATPATGGGRIGFPEDHPHFLGVLPPAIGPLSETLAGHDLMLVVGSSVFPYYPNIPGPLLPDGARAGRDHERPRRGGARADGRRDRRRRRARRSRRCSSARADSERDAPAAARPRPSRAERGRPDERARRPWPRSPTSGPRTAIAVARVAVEHARAAQPPAAVAARQLLLQRRRRARLRARRRRSACSSRSPSGRSCACSARARRSTRSQALWTAAAYDVPVTFLVLRNEEYAILKWFAELEQVDGRARARPAGARRRAVAEGYGVPTRRGRRAARS